LSAKTQKMLLLVWIPVIDLLVCFVHIPEFS